MRKRAVFIIPLSLLVAGKCLAADQSEANSLSIHHMNGVKTKKKTKKQVSNTSTNENLEVRGRRPSTSGASATKTDTPLVETAQSVTVITRDEMDVRGALTLNQAIRYAAGVTPDLRGGEGTRYDLFQLRGFTVS